MPTNRRAPSFPIVADIRKGSPMGTSRTPRYKGGDDLQDRFRVVFSPGTEALQEKFLAIYKTLEPTRIRAMVPFPDIWQGWECYNEAYNTGRLIARADDDHYLLLRNPLTGEYTVKDGQPYKPFKPGDVITYQADGKTITLKVRPVGRLRLWLPELEHMVMLELKTTSYYDTINISAQLAAIEGIAFAINGGNCAGVPFYIYRKQQNIVWNRPDGGAQRVDKWLIQIEADPVFVKKALSRMSDFALTGGQTVGLLQPGAPITGEIDPEHDEFDEEAVPGTFIEAPAQEQPFLEQTSNLPATAAASPVDEKKAAEAPSTPSQPAERPLAPETLKSMLERRAKAKHNARATQDQIGLVAMLLDECFAGMGDKPSKIRHTTLGYLCGTESLNLLEPAMILALLDWLKPTKDERNEHHPDQCAVTEARAAATLARKTAGHLEMF